MPMVQIQCFFVTDLPTCQEAVIAVPIDAANVSIS